MEWRKRVLPACCVLAILVGGCERKPEGAGAKGAAPTGVKIALGLKPKAGERLLMVMETNQAVTQTPPGGRQQVINQDVHMEMEYLVRGVDSSGVSTVGVTYKRMRMNSPAGNGDSAGTGTSAMDRIFRAMCGKAFEVDFAPNGEIPAVRGLSVIYEGIGAALPELTAVQRGQLMAQMKTQFGEEAMKKQLGMSSAIYPDRAVDNGDLWQKAMRMDNFGIEVNSDYKLLEHDATTATIGVTGKLTPVPIATPLQIGNMALRYALSGAQKGTIHMDVQEGWPRKIDMAQDFSGTVEASGPGIPGTQRWPMSIKTTVTVEMQ